MPRLGLLKLWGDVVRFNGSDYIHKTDSPRLSDQHLRVRNLMSDHAWRTLKEISRAIDDPEASISAQLRHLRKKRFGSFVIEKKLEGTEKMDSLSIE